MNTINSKRVYTTPQIERVELDNEISLALESTPPIGPDEVAAFFAPEYFNHDPFKIE
jgi:hypothetical protein